MDKVTAEEAAKLEKDNGKEGLEERVKNEMSTRTGVFPKDFPDSCFLRMYPVVLLGQVFGFAQRPAESPAEPPLFSSKSDTPWALGVFGMLKRGELTDGGTDDDGGNSGGNDDGGKKSGLWRLGLSLMIVVILTLMAVGVAWRIRAKQRRTDAFPEVSEDVVVAENSL